MIEDLARAIAQALNTWPGCKTDCPAQCAALTGRQCWRACLWIAEACEAVVAARDGKDALIETIPNSDPIERAMMRAGFDPSNPGN